MRTYGKEWRISEGVNSPAVDEIVKHLGEHVTSDGASLLGATLIGERSEAHWRLDCEEMGVHTHIYLKWTTDEPA